MSAILTANTASSSLSSAPARPAAKAKTSYWYKLFRVKRSDGRVTTVSMDPVLVTKAIQAIPGGMPAVSALVRENALNFQSGMGKSCSGYVRERLLAEMSSQHEQRERRRSERAAMA